MNADTILSFQQIQIETAEQLRSAFRDYRDGSYAAFHFSHASPYPRLGVYINGPVAYIHYFPAKDHPGFQSVADPPSGTKFGETVRFLQAGGCEADGFDLPDYTTVPVERALAAAQEFLHAPSLPTCLRWTEL